MRVITMAVLLGLGTVLAAHARAADPSTPSTPSTEYQVLQKRPDRLIVELPNRLVVIAQRIPTAAVASAQCWIKTGSIYEQQHNGAGLSHFLEHLASGGTTATRTEAESNAILGSIGAQTNAATSLDTVRYYINTSSEDVGTAVELLTDWMRHSRITDEEFARERDVIQREFEMGRGEPNRIFWKLTQQARYQAHPARHPTIGYIDEFLKITPEEIRDFYHTMYVPNNMVFVVVGDIDPEAIVEQVAALWRDAEAKELPELSFPIEPRPEQPQTVTGYADVQTPRLRLAWPATRIGAEHDYALDLLGQILGQGELSRLVQTVRDQRQLVTQIDAYNLSFPWGEGFFGIDARVPLEQMEQAEAAILDQVDRIQAEGVTADELDRAKAKVRASVAYNAQTAQATASRLASDFIGFGDPDYLNRYAEAIQQVTAEQVRAAARAILRDRTRITIELLPSTDEQVQKLERPAEPAVTFETEPVDLDNQRRVEWFEQLRSEQREVAEPRSEPMKLVTLDNGLRVLIERDTRLPVVSLQWYHLGGLLADEPGREGVANAMSAMMLKGAGDLTADEISRRLEETGSQMSSGCGNNTFYVTAQALTEHFPPVLELMATVIAEPTFPEDEWAKMRPRLLDAVRAIDERWSSQLISTFQEHYFGEHPWSQMTAGRAEVIESLDAEQLRRFHRARIAAPDGVLAIVGDVEPDEVERRVREHFGRLPGEAELPFEAAEPQPRVPGVEQATTAKPLTAVQIGFAPGLARDNPDYAAMTVMTKVVSNFPAGWLHQALRGEGPGLVYASAAFSRTGVIPGYWSIVFNTSAASAPEAIRRSRAVVDRLRDETVDEATLRRARSTALVSEVIGQEANGRRATQAALDELYGVGFANADQLAAQIRQTTAADIQRVARRYLRESLTLILSNEPVELEAPAADAAATP